MPPIHHALTGGSLYNNSVLAYLEKRGSVELHVPSAAADYAAFTGGLWLVDSLCLRTGAHHLKRCRDAQGVLIAHYLNVLDLAGQASSEAQAELLALQLFQAVIATSGYSRRVLIEAGYQGRVEAILPGLNATYRRPVTPRPLGPVKILTVATLLPGKGLSELLSALEHLRDLEWTWEIVGDPALDAAFAQELSARLNRSLIRDRVSLRGAMAPELVEGAYDDAGVFALPSRFETCSMATMEAMARGLPVVAFRVGGLPDLLPEVSRLQLADPGDIDGFARTLRSLIENAADRSGLGAANRDASQKFPSWEDSGRAVENLLREISSPEGLAP
jgi:hypothetical protein